MSDPKQIVDDMVRRAGMAQQAKKYQIAAFLYSEALHWSPGEPGLHVQCGHMFKEAGDLEAAEREYRTAAELIPEDAELSLQLGHFYKCAGRLGAARLAYERALALRPGWDAPAEELEHLSSAGWREPGQDEIARSYGALGGLAASEGQTITADSRNQGLAPELAPRPLFETFHAHEEGIEIRGLGRRERTHWGVQQTLRGVEAFRGFCISDRPVLTIELFLNGGLIYRGGVKGGYELEHEVENRRLRKYVFNIWIDLSGFIAGRYELRYRATDIDHRSWSKTEQVVIAVPLTQTSVLPDSDALVPRPDPADDRSLDEQINARPSMVREGRRALLKEQPRTVLVQRADQLGDLVVSIPAIRRLREILPQARLVGLVTRGNAELASALALFDELVVTDFPYDAWERRRVMSVEAQAALAVELSRFDFDLAIDLAELGRSRLLLPFSNSPVMVGFHAEDEVPGLAVDVAGNSYDRGNGHEAVPHSNKSLGLIEWLGAMMRSEPNLMKRTDLDRGSLTSLGVQSDIDFVVLHAGGRYRFSQWPHYVALSELILKQTDLRVVMLTEDTGARDRLPPTLMQSDDFLLLDHRLAFDELDALVSFCTVFIGDDSGVKHMASLRGAHVIGIQNARNNWSEWGQESGYVITRKVPCAGCLIQNESDSQECGREFVCINNIRPEEVFSAMRELIASGSR